MSFSAGTYSLPGPALNTGDTVSATENNTFRNDVATAFNLTMLRNGTSTATANLPMGGFKLTGLGNGTSNGDSLAYGQTADAVIYGLTVGRGAGAVASNTAVGASALAANSTGARNTAIGYLAGTTTNDSYNVFVGYQAGKLNTGNTNTAVGDNALASSGAGSNNAALGQGALGGNTTGGSNTGIGTSALASNTTASNNTAVGYQAGYSTTTGANNVFFGYLTGYATTGSYNTFIGRNAGAANTSGAQNAFIGESSGVLMTTGSKNSILGSYNGNQGGLDIRTASNNIVLSDGDGNPRLYYSGGVWEVDAPSFMRINQTTNNYSLLYYKNSSGVQWYTAATTSATPDFRVVSGNGTGVFISWTGTGWGSVSDERLKTDLTPIANAAEKVSSLRSVTGRYKTDPEGTSRAFLIAQDVQAVLPEAVSITTLNEQDTTEYLGVSYTEVIPLLVAAIKELKAEIETLKGN